MPPAPRRRSHFNSRPSARGDAFPSVLHPDGRNISIHAPPRGATAAERDAGRSKIFQFTPLREGRQLLQGSVRQSHYFNSRPSARGDSHDQALFPAEQDISIHAPPRGATSYFDSVPHKATKFQFTPLREGRPSTNSIKDGTSAISIHAPPRGATHRHWYILRLHRDFNSRPSARGDKVFRITSDARDIFQFTPLREGRQQNVATWLIWRGYFNSRPSARGDERMRALLRSGVQFQFTPLREGRRAQRWNRLVEMISIHAPPRGATRFRISAKRGRKYFNSRPSARGDERMRALLRSGVQFQFTPLREGRRAQRWNRLVEMISIHAPPRGATRFRISAKRGRKYFNSRPSARGDYLC